jgi:hypothetical protein
MVYGLIGGAVRSLLVVVSLMLAGCGPEPSPEDEHPTPETAEAPRLAPPPAEGDAIGREEVVRLARAHAEPDDAIRALDARRFAFALDDAALTWLGRQGLEPQVLDYLNKRAKVDWEALRGDIPPDRD